ncbi:MAG: protein phosphatase 2C domain-containing protein [Bryobacteraceae bacterium]
MLDVEFAQVSDAGRMREHNEDYLGSAVPATAAEMRSLGWLFALADGVGGQEAGEVASRTAVENLLAGFRQAAPNAPLGDLLTRLVQAANANVLEAGHNARPGGVEMATTLVACALRYDRAVIAHVGDSRCYLIRGGRATALTRDHTVANEQLRMGAVAARDAIGVANRHILSRSLGSAMAVGVDIGEQQVAPGDVLLLCSDGLYASVTEADMAGIVSQNAGLDAAAAKLVGLAKTRDGSDNISVQLIRVRAVERVGMYRGRPYSLR